jgi:Ribonuclease G/E
MKAEIAIYPENDSTCCVRLEDGRPVERLLACPERLNRQDILLGLVRKVQTALDAVFIDIGSDHDGMLPLSEAGPDAKPGQRVLVQIKRLRPAGKGHLLTTRIELPGPFAVFRADGPPNPRSKLRDFDETLRQHLYVEDLDRLQKVWQDISQQSSHSTAPRLLLAAGDPLVIALTALVTADVQLIHIEGDLLFDQVFQMVQTIMPFYLPLLALHVPDKGYGLAAALDLADLRERLNERKVWLSQGGSLLIEPAETLTVIDVNSGKDVRGDDPAELRRRTNQAAALEIARQLRLRNIGGMILIDFIRQDDPTDRETLLTTMRAVLSRDRARCKVYGFTQLGLLEMVRTAV